MIPTRFVVTMDSEEYGAESFSYGTKAEALDGLRRLADKGHSLFDGVQRCFTLSEEVEWDGGETDWPPSDTEVSNG